jgi:hypothetical protein
MAELLAGGRGQFIAHGQGRWSNPLALSLWTTSEFPTDFSSPVTQFPKSWLTPVTYEESPEMLGNPERARLAGTHKVPVAAHEDDHRTGRLGIKRGPGVVGHDASAGQKLS